MKNRTGFRLSHNLTTGKWRVVIALRARFLLKGRPHPEALTIHGIRACRRRSPHMVYFETLHEFDTKEDALHLIRELKAGQT